MAKLKVSELQAASNVSVNDTLYLVQNGVSKQVSVATFRANTLGLPQVSKTTDYVLTYADQDKHIYFTNTSDVTLYIPNNSEVNWPVGTQITIITNNMYNAYANINGNTGVLLYCTDPGLTSPQNRRQNQRAISDLYNVAANTWFITALSGHGLT
jgi:hypothetical protein